MPEAPVQRPLQPGLHLAFYHGRGNWQDAVIRRVTGSIYSHVEFVLLTEAGWPAGPMAALASSPRDGGVRERVIDFDPSRWVMVPVADPAAWDRARLFLGAEYDWPGVILRHGLGLPYHSRRRWFCSELCAWAMGWAGPEQYTPGSIARRLGL